MTLEQYIKELLFQHECVTVPGFGAFLTRTYNFSSDDLTGQFFPSRKEITFNSLLLSNDGILANYFAKKQNITYEKALRLIEKEIRSWKKKLNTQSLFIGSLGEIKLNENKKIIFKPYGRLNFDSTSYGLRPFKISSSVSLKKSNSKLFNPKKDKLVFIPISKQRNLSVLRTYYKYASIGLIGLVLTSSFFYFGQQHIENKRLLNQEVAQNKVQNKVQAATFNLGSLNSLNLSIGIVKTENVNKLKHTYYTIVAGTFRNKLYAKRKIETLKKKGYASEMAEVNPEGMFRVAYGRFKSKKEAIKLLYSLKYVQKKDAWYLLEK